MVLYNIVTGEQQHIAVQNGTISDIRFSPDSSALVFSLKQYDSAHWQVNVLDLGTGDIRVLHEGVNTPMYQPISWTPHGIVATSVMFYAANTGPEGLFLLSPSNNIVQTIRRIDQPYVQAVASPDGNQLAIIECEIGLGIEFPTSGLVIQRLPAGETKQLEPEEAGLIFNVRWSPDSAKLIYTRPRNDGPPPTGYTIAGPTTEPTSLDLSAVSLDLRDIAWRNNDTLVLLTIEGEQDKLYEIPADAADAVTPREFATLNVPSEQAGSVILYVDQ